MIQPMTLINPVPTSGWNKNDGYDGDSGLDNLVPANTPCVCAADAVIEYAEPAANRRSRHQPGRLSTMALNNHLVSFGSHQLNSGAPTFFPLALGVLLSTAVLPLFSPTHAEPYLGTANSPAFACPARRLGVGPGGRALRQCLLAAYSTLLSPEPLHGGRTLTPWQVLWGTPGSASPAPIRPYASITADSSRRPSSVHRGSMPVRAASTAVSLCCRHSVRIKWLTLFLRFRGLSAASTKVGGAFVL
jgi:hypothetical protein